MVINVNKIYLYIFPLFLAFRYPRVLIDYQHMLAYVIGFLALLVLLKNIQKTKYIKSALSSLVLISVLLFITSGYEIWQTTNQPYYLFSSLIYIAVFIDFLDKSSLNKKGRYLNFLMILTLLYMLAPFYNYLYRPYYPGGNGMMYHVVGMYMIYLALRVHINNEYTVAKDVFFILLILAFDLIVAKTRGVFPLIISLIFFNMFAFKYVASSKVKKVPYVKYIFFYIILIIVGLLPIAMFFGYADFLLQVFITRSSNYSLEATTGRPYLFLQWVEYFIQTILYQKNVELPNGLGVHNTFFHLMLRYGVLGLIIYLTFIGYLLNRVMRVDIYRGRKIPLYLLLVSIVMLLNVASLFIDNDMAVWIGVFLFFYILGKRCKSSIKKSARIDDKNTADMVIVSEDDLDGKKLIINS
jgi:hypothetical protein